MVSFAPRREGMAAAVLGEIDLLRPQHGKGRGGQGFRFSPKAARFWRFALGSNAAILKKIGKGGTANGKELSGQMSYLFSKSTAIFGNAVTHDPDAKGLAREERKEVVGTWVEGWRGTPKNGHTTHLLMSFPSHVRPEKAKLIAEAWAFEMFQSGEHQEDEWAYVAALHTDRPHPHVHIVLNNRGLVRDSWFYMARDHVFNLAMMKERMVAIAAEEGVFLDATSRAERGILSYGPSRAEVERARREGRAPEERMREGRALEDALATFAQSADVMRGLAHVVAGEMGLNADGTPGPSYEPGMELRGKYVLIAEGVRGSLAKELIGKYDLSKGHEPQKFGLGMKEIWEIPAEKARPGTVTHTMGWPLGKNAGGGSFIYHLEGNQVLVGFVVHLNYRNPYLYPYMEFQRFKHHPMVAELLEGGKRVAYGARAISEGGWQSIPKLTVPGAALLGCSAGLVNVPRIKGNHNAMLSGITAAEAAAAAIAAGRAGDELTDYETEVRQGAIARDLKPVRNVKPVWSRLGLYPSLMLGGFDMWVANLTGWNPLGTWKHGKTDAQATGKAADFKPIDYPRPDGKLSFDRLTNVAFSFTNHEESQPCHLRLKDPAVPISVNLPVYAEPATRYCPAGVYEVLEGPEGPKFQINFQNCVHCKTCDIKDPSQNINWTTPQGGDGPNYPNM